MQTPCRHRQDGGRHTPAALLLALTSVFVPSLVHAQSASDIAARRGLIDSAQQARAAGDHVRALDLAERAGRLSMTPSLRLFIAQEQYELGRLAEAYGNADTCMREADRDRTLRNRTVILTACRSLADTLRSRIGYVVVRVPASTPAGLEVTVAGHPLMPVFYGAPYVVTPGAVLIEARAPGYVPFHQEVSVAPGTTQDVTITLEREPLPPPTPETSTASSPVASSLARGTSPVASSPAPVPSPVVPSSTPVTSSTASHGTSVGPWVVGTTGLAALVGAAVFFLLRNAELDRCPPPEYLCPDQATIDRAVLFNGLSIGALAMGVTGVTAGVVWFIIDRSTTRGRAAVSLQITSSSEHPWLGLRGNF